MGEATGDAVIGSGRWLMHALRVALTPVEETPPSAALEHLSRAKDWNELEARIVEHRIGPLLYAGLRDHDALERLPEPVVTSLRAQYEETRAHTALLLWSLHALTAMMASRGVVPTVCKGVVVASHYYREPAMRPMGDIDMWIQPHEVEPCGAVLESAGLRPMVEKTTPVAKYWGNDQGVMFDVHARMELFEGKTVETRVHPGGSFRIYDPHALITHLVVHMHGHAPETGIVLGWLVDLALVLRKEAHGLDLKRLRGLFPDRTTWVLFLRLARFLEAGFGVDYPERLSVLVRSVVPLDVEQIVRGRGLATWGLPGPRGWLRLAAGAAGFREYSGLRQPSWQEIVMWPAGGVADWVAARRSALAVSRRG